MTRSNLVLHWASVCALLLALCATTVSQADPKDISRERPRLADSDHSQTAPTIELNSGGFTSKISGMAFSPDGNLLAAAGFESVRIWDVRSGELVATLRGYYENDLKIGAAVDVRFSPDGESLVVSSLDFTGAGAIRIYRVGQWDAIAEVMPDVTGICGLLDFSADGKRLAVFGVNFKSYEAELLHFDWPRRTLLGRYLKPNDETRGEEQSNTFATMPAYFGYMGRSDELWLLSYNSSELYSAADWKPLENSDGVAADTEDLISRLDSAQWPKYAADAAEHAIYHVRLDLARALIAGNGKRNGKAVYWAAFYSTQDAEPLQVYGGHRDVPTAVTLNRDGTVAATADGLGEIHVWKTANGKRMHYFHSDVRPLYRVAFSRDGNEIAFGSTTYGADKWAANRYAGLEQVFDLSHRVLHDDAAGNFVDSTDQLGGYQLKVKRRGSEFIYDTNVLRAGKTLGKIETDQQPFAWLLPRQKIAGLRLPVIISTKSPGDLCLYDGLADDPKHSQRRFFDTAEGIFTSCVDSPDGRLLATANTDGIMRIFSLEKLQRRGVLDLNVDFDEKFRVTHVYRAGQAEGFKVGDAVRSVDGEDLAEMYERLPFEPELFEKYADGQRVKITVDRDGAEHAIEVKLPRGADSVEPLLSLYIARNGEWVIWTPRGHYDASPGGATLIGWRVNGKLVEAAQYFPAARFRELLYRPDVIDAVLREGDVDAAIAAADAARPRAPQSVDLRDREQFDKLQPPTVRIVSPKPGDADEGVVTVVAEVRSPGKAEVKDVTFLVNGRPSAAKGIARERAAAATDDETDEVSTFEQDVQLVPGENYLSVVAVANQTLGASPAVRVDYEPAAVEADTRPQLYVLALGCSKYANDDYNLRYAASDARDFVAAWQAQKGKFYRDVHVKLLVDEEATSDNLRDGLDWLVKGVTQYDIAMLFVSGHGVRDSNQNYYLATHNLEIDRLRATAVPHSDIKLLMESMPCKTLLFADTCHAGAITGAKSANVDDPWRDLVAEEVGAIVFASSGPRELSIEDPRWEHGAFTKAILDAISDVKTDATGDGFLSLLELDLQISERVKMLTEGRQHPVTGRPLTIRNFNLAKMPSK